jgi:hypothetical protein
MRHSLARDLKGCPLIWLAEVDYVEMRILMYRSVGNVKRDFAGEPTVSVLHSSSPDFSSTFMTWGVPPVLAVVLPFDTTKSLFYVRAGILHTTQTQVRAARLRRPARALKIRLSLSRVADSGRKRAFRIRDGEVQRLQGFVTCW